MYTREEIDAIKKKWIDKAKEYKKCCDSTKKKADELNGNVTDELREEDKRNNKIYKDVLRFKKEYQDACEENLNEKLSQITDPLEKEMIEKRFRDKIVGNDDYDDIMNELELW